MLMIALTSLILMLLPAFLSRNSFLLVRPFVLKDLSDFKMYYSSDSLHFKGAVAMDLVTWLKQHGFGVPGVCETLFKTVTPKGSFGVGWHSVAVSLPQHHARGALQSPSPAVLT